MGEVPRSSAGFRLLLRLLSTVAALCVLSLSGRAQATPLTGTAPMCGEHNESVAAPPIFRASDDGSITSLPCQAPEQIRSGHGLPLAPERVSVYERPERVLGSPALHVAEDASSRLPVARAGFVLPRPGFGATLLRPPRG